jgi:Cu+-exporting ATPase
VTIAARAAATEAVRLDIEGMTCASCAARIERRLNALDGVEAVVNYATETAAVSLAPGTTTDGAQLIEAVSAAGYHASLPTTSGADSNDAHDHGSSSSLRARTIVAAVLGVPVVAVSMVPAWQFDAWQWVALAMTVPVVLWSGWPIHRAALNSLVHRSATMDTLVSIGVLTAFGWSLWALLFGGAGEIGMRMSMALRPAHAADHAELYFEAAAGVILFVSFGRMLEARAKDRAGSALRSLLALGAHDAAVLRDGVEVRVPVDELDVGMRFVVRPGETIATDGVVVDGRSAIDASLLTGESNPIEVGPDDAVTGATVNVGGRLVVEATRVGADTQLAKIGRLVTEAQDSKSSIQRLADRISAVFVPVVLGLATITLAGWLFGSAPLSQAVAAAVAVLVIACPCALGLATPTALLVGGGRGAQLGLLIRSPEVFETTRRADTVVLDKTGTVTSGAMGVVGVDVAADGRLDEARLVDLAGALEHASAHPVGRAIAGRALAANPALAEPSSFASIDGLGVEGVVDGHRVVVGRPSLLAERGITLDASLEAARAAAEHAATTAVAVGVDGRAAGIIRVADTVKPTSRAAVAELRALGLEPILLTGDSRAVAETIAEEVGIDRVIAEVLPAEKVAVVKDLQSQGRVVAMVGDGVNDAAALATADLGLALGTGADVAIEAGDLTLVHGDLRSAPDAIRLARRIHGTIRANLFWAFAYNVAAIPLAATGQLNPMIAGAVMAMSDLVVMGNSLRLRRFSPS